jgi:hypothetical protein
MDGISATLRYFRRRLPGSRASRSMIVVEKDARPVAIYHDHGKRTH